MNLNTKRRYNNQNEKRGNEVVAVQAPAAKQAMQPVAPVEVETTVAAAQAEVPKQEERRLFKMKTYIKSHHRW